MKKKTFYHSLLHGIMMLTAVLFSACTEELNTEITTNLISFTVDDTYFGEEGTPTRGAKVSSVSSFGVSASIYSAASTYTSAGCGSYFFNESASAGVPVNYFWPISDYKLSFFAYYPYGNSAFTIQSAANATGAPTYAYTVPSAIANQVDVMTAQNVNILGGGSSPVSLTFKHRCAAIRFSVTNDRSSAITLNSVSIEGVKYSGTLNEETWTLGSAVNSSSSNPFTLNYGSSIAASATVDVTGTTDIFLMLPQTLPATAKVKLVVDNEELEAEITGTWVAGKQYNYSLTVKNDVIIIVDEDTDIEDWEPTAIDLSMVDNAGNPRESMTTANCYLVHSAGKYKIPLVYGNAIKNGTANIQAYSPTASSNSETYLTPFINHNGTGITGPWITKNGAGIDAGMGLTATSATLIWQDVMGLISAVGVNGDYLTFTVGTFIPGNAVIAVKDVSGIILWSWHIWATPETYTNLTSVNTGDFEYHVAPVNLGWVPINENGKQGFCPYYQWGRKDPEIPSTGDGNYNHAAYDITGNSVSMVQKTYTKTGTGEGYGTIQNGIKYPLNHYYNYISNNNGIYGPFQSWQYNLWDADCVGIVAAANSSISVLKTVYDPCPPGFCIPSGGLCYYMYTTRDAFAGSFDSTNKGYNWNGSLWFPATGMRVKDLGQTPSNVEINGFCWSSSKGGKSSAYANFYATTFFSMTTSNTANAYPIRPVAEE